MWWLLAACVSCLFFCAGVLGTFVPLQNPTGVEYVFAAPPAAAVLPAWLLCAVVLGAAFLAVRARARARSLQDFTEANAGRWLAPIAAIGVVALGILPAVPGVGEHGSVVGYFLYDLRWWWAVVLAALALARADRLIGAPFGGVARRIAGWAPASRLLLLDSMLFVTVVAWAASTSAIRFSTELTGDEPKYVRYCEAWYQGQGFDIASLALVRDVPLDARPSLLRNGSLLLSAIPQGVGALARDLNDFARDPSTFRWNRASSTGGFVTGVHGGLYQIHEAGVCAVLFPGYFVDRYLLSIDSSPDGKWPADLTMTNVMMLLTYGLCSVVLFRLFRHALGSEPLAWIWAAMAMLTLPTGAFAFQLYPELPALLIIAAVSNELLFGGRSRAPGAAAAGAAAAALAWLHVRFLLVCLSLAAVAVFGRRVLRVRLKPDTTYGWAFLGAFALVMFSVMAFDYHVTGSWLPTARMDADGQRVTFARLGFILNFIGYGLDRLWGLFPHSVVLLGAVPGLVMLGRQSRGPAAFVALIVLALVVPASGYTLVTGGTTPGRFVAAVVPLLIWPVAVLVRRWWGSQSVRVITVAFGVIALDAARAYNWHHDKPFAVLRDASLSGWKANLAFPVIRGDGWTSPANLALFLCLAAVVAGLSWMAFVRIPRPAAAARDSRWKPAIVIAALIAAFSVATSANQDWTHPLYLLDDGTARADAIRAVVNTNRCFCFTSARGPVNWTTMRPNSARSALVGLHPDDLRLTIQVLVEGDGQVPAFGRMRVEFGDGEQTAWIGVLTEGRVAHAYRRPGAYPVKVWFQLPTRVSPQLHAQTVEMRAPRTLRAP
jgi:hypothetical protein